MRLPGANDRLHQFILDGMWVNRRHAARSRALYYPYVEPSKGHGRELLSTLASHASVVVTDWYPAFFLPRMIAAAAARLSVLLEAVDANGLIPLAEHGRAFTAARFYRAFVQRLLRDHVTQVPEEAPLRRLRRVPRLASLPRTVSRRWPQASARLLTTGARALAALPIDHSIAPVAIRGGSDAAARTLRGFVSGKLSSYDLHRSNPDDDGTSRLSPYLHFGHMSAHEVFLGRDDARALDDEAPWRQRAPAGARGGGASRRRRRRFSTSSSCGASSRFNGCEYITDYADYRVASRVGAYNARSARDRPASTYLHARATRVGTD